MYVYVPPVSVLVLFFSPFLSSCSMWERALHSALHFIIPLRLTTPMSSDSPCPPLPPYKKKHHQLRFFFLFSLIRRLFSSSSSPIHRLEEQGKEEEKEAEVGIVVAEEEMVREDFCCRGGSEMGTVLQRSVKQLHFGGWEEKEAAAVQIQRIAKEGHALRKSLAALGVIPSLVSMLDSGDDRRRRLAVKALIELAHGTYTNKAIMVEAGLLGKLKSLMATQDQSRRKELLALLLSISYLDKTQFRIASSSSSCDILLPFLIEILNSGTGIDEVKLTFLAILCNLSTKLENAKPIVSSGVVPVLLRLSKERPASGRALATLANLVVTAVGRKAIEEDDIVPGCFIDIMGWDDNEPGSQEFAACVLMVLAHGSLVQRRKMAELGIVPVLLEVALLGSPPAQKRAFKLLEWFKGEKQGVVRVYSGSQAERTSGSFKDITIDKKEPKEHRKAMQKMVKQSLNKNMESILRRASNDGEVASPDNPRLLGSSSSSKSLPY